VYKNSKQDAIDWLTWTYFFRRLVKNPSYYDLPRYVLRFPNPASAFACSRLTLSFIHLTAWSTR
jgi:hypothetical protein